MSSQKDLVARSVVAAAAALACAVSTAWAIPSPSLDDSASSAPAPSAADTTTYNEALALMKKGDDLSALSKDKTSADQSSAEGAKQAYASARAKLQALTARSPQLAEAWNSLGYTQRQLGSYDDALASYAKALELRPGYPEALEYRGEAYLRLGRIADAKQAYLDLYASDRKLSGQFLDAIKVWIRQQQAAKGSNTEAVADFDHWVKERAQIAGQTAALTREGAAASWR